VSSRLLAIAAVVVAAGCAPRDGEIRRQRLLAERRNLEASFDRLEERMVANQARVRLWQEMKARHESVTAIACASQDEHASEMARRVLPDEPHRVAGRRSSLYQARVAAVPASASEPAAPPLPAAR
jgi:hypothetical protein